MVGNMYTFMVWARRDKVVLDPYDPPVISLEIGPMRDIKSDRGQEHVLAKPDTRWRNYYLEVPYRDYRKGMFALRRSSEKGKASGAVLGIDDVEVFHHAQPGSIGLAATGQETEKLRLNFFYKGIFHPVELDAVRKGQGEVEKWANNHAHNDYLEFWAELGGDAITVLPFPCLVARAILVFEAFVLPGFSGLPGRDDFILE